MNQIQKTTVLPGETDALRVEITIADTSDIIDAREAVTLIAVVQGSENPSLIDIQRLAVNRARDLIDEAMRALAPRQAA
jgi:hypothetical protein